jgi:nucleotide-binding universal stress UspA family protein
MIKMFKKILCPVDFTADSFNAADYSNELSILSGAELILVHIKDLMAISQGRLPMEGDAVTTEVENIAKDQMNELVTKLANRNSTNKIKTFIKGGINTGEALLSTLKEHQPDLLVMYTAGITGIGDKITGTKTDKIIDKTSIPLLLVPGTFKFSPVKSILFSTDNKGNEKPNLEFVIQFANLLTLIPIFSIYL